MWGLATRAVGAARAATTGVCNATYAAATYLYLTTPTNGDVATPNSRPNTPPPVDGLFSAQVPTEEFSKDQERVQEALRFLKTAHYSKFQKTRFQGIIDDLNIILNEICKLQKEEKLKFQKTGQVVCLSELHINLQIQQLHSKYKFKVLGETENQLRTYLTKFSRNQSLECKATAPMIDLPKKELLDQVVEKFALAFSHYFFKRTSKIYDDPSFFEKEYYKINIFIQLIKENPESQPGEDIIEKIVGSFADFPLAGECALRDAFQFLRSFILMSIGSEEVDKLEDEIDSIRALVTDKVKINLIKISDDDKIIAKDISEEFAKKKKKKPRMPEIEDQAGTWQTPGVRQEDFENSEQALAFIQRVCALNQECDDKSLVKFACAIQNNLFKPDNNDAISIFLQLIRDGKIKNSHAIYRFAVAITSTETKGDISYFHQVFAELICNRKITIPIVHEVFSNAISDNRVSDQNVIYFFAKSILLGIVSRESAKSFIAYFEEQYKSGGNIIFIDTSSGVYLSNLFLKYTSGDETVYHESDFSPLPGSGRNSRASSIVSAHSAPLSIPSSRSVTPAPEIVEEEPVVVLEPVAEVVIERREETDAEKAWRLGTEPEEGFVFNDREYEDFSTKIEAGEITDWNVIKTFSKAFFDKQTIFKTNPSLTFRFLSFLIQKIDREQEWDETQKSGLKKKANDALKNCLIDFSRNIDSATHFEALENFVKLLANGITFPIHEAYCSFIQKIESGDISDVEIIARFSEVFLSERTTNPIAFDLVAIADLIRFVEQIRLKNTNTSMPQTTILEYIKLEEKLKKKSLLLKHDEKVHKDYLNLFSRIKDQRNEGIKDQLRENFKNARNTENQLAGTRLSIESAEDLSAQLDFDYHDFTAALNPPPAPKKSRWQRTKEFFSNLLPSFRRARV